MSLSYSHDHLGSVWYHLEPSEGPYSPNQQLSRTIFYRLLQQISFSALFLTKIDVMHELCVGGRDQSESKRPQQQGVIQAGCGGGAGPLLLTANSSLRPQILMSPGLTTPSPSYSNGNQKDNSLLECYQAKSNHESTSNYSMKQLLNAE